ncbi:MAG: hypothetical protein HDT35_00335 [Clostridiales bacterium]|nr:hypothetical protein [Clostridiales bacterium]
MDAIEIARRMAELGSAEDACQAYTLALRGGTLAPEEEMEAAVYILQSGGDYKVAYTCFCGLYGRGVFREDCLSIMTAAFYEPNIKLLKARYEKNCRALSKYPYLFRKDFPAFEELPIRFYPFDDDGYLPFFPREGRFGEYVNFKNPVIGRNFFHDLENPILAKDVYSQYELEYLNDNVRRSEDIARENHIYLHYSDWAAFCAYLQCLNVRRLLKDKKLVFLIGDEIEQYPIDFKARFGIDYSGFEVKPIGIRDVHRLIWHTQLATHNGGDFFNEVFDSHPNLVILPSVMMGDVETAINTYRKNLDVIGDARTAEALLTKLKRPVARELFQLQDRTDKDIAVAIFLSLRDYAAQLDHTSRIAPALFFQPHFPNILYDLTLDARGRAVLSCPQLEQIRNSPVFRAFKYIKTFTPMRRITTSYGASNRFLAAMATVQSEEEREGHVTFDHVAGRVQNRSYMIDPEDRLYKDSVLVRFEDSKLNPKATFTALAAFLDIPYTESMTYCSTEGERDKTTLGNDIGFSTGAVYRTYDEYATDAERCYIEYLMRDAYAYYGYDFQYYDGGPMDEERVRELIRGFTAMNGLMCESWQKNILPKARLLRDGEEVADDEIVAGRAELLNRIIAQADEDRLRIAKLLSKDLHFVNKNGQPLRMMPKLELDPALLEQPLYH